MPTQRMAVARTKGDPNQVAAAAISALYGTVYPLKFALKKLGKDLKVGAPRVRWPDPLTVPKQEWAGIWGVPIPNDTEELPRKETAVAVTIEDWDYGTVAEILHIGPYTEESASIERLSAFIAENGYEIAGAHEEEYLTKPDATVQKTMIRYPVRKVTAAS